MDTSLLKTFATAARVQLLREVSARLSVVLATSSIARVEARGAVSALERAIAAQGGGDIGQKAVIDQVAYMWFNRIISLRFMDANGYTGIGVVSPDASFPNAQPQILTQAKLGQIDPDVLDAKLLARVAGLLNGTIRSEDAQNEAYGILLTAYCRHWNRSMPFMFEKEGDFTELLIPANLLSDESVMAKALQTLTLEVCKDVEVIGWLYQFYIAERKDEVFAGFKKNHKAGPSEIPAATQLFTPDWIVRYLVENSLGRLWLLNHPDSKLADQMEFYIPPIDIESDFIQIVSPVDIKVMDPSCGSGHMLTYAFDLLYSIYEEEGYSPAEIPILILNNNLFGLEIDSRAGALAAFALAMKARAKLRTFFTMELAPNICVLQSIRFTANELRELMSLVGFRLEEEDFLNQFEDADTYGSLIIPNDYVTTDLENHLITIDVNTLHGLDLFDRAKRVIEQAKFLSQRYHVIVANPPYMGNGNMAAGLSDWAKRNYPETKSDLFAMFIERSLELTLPQGYVGMITMQSWMFLSSYRKIRQRLLAEKSILAMAHLGTNAFDSIGGDVVSTTAFILLNSPQPNLRGCYVRLTTQKNELEKSSALKLSKTTRGAYSYVAGQEFSFMESCPIAYWLSPAMRSTFSQGKKLGSLADVKHGLSTGKNDALIRFWSEVSLRDFGISEASREAALASGHKWFPYNKGGRFRRWSGNAEYVLRYDAYGNDYMASLSGHRHDGKSHYFLPGVTWSKVSSGLPAFRYIPQGFIFDVAGNSYFPKDPNDIWDLLAFSNSTVVKEILKAIAPTINFEAGHISSLPVLRNQLFDVMETAKRLVALSTDDWNEQETSWSFLRSPLLMTGLQDTSLAETELAMAARKAATVIEARELEEFINASFIRAYGLEEELSSTVAIEEVSLFANPVYRYGFGKTASEYIQLERSDTIRDFISYAVGCMFGRYSLEIVGLILGNQNDVLKDYLDLVPNPSFMPDKDNVIPVTDSEWFEDDIVVRFRKFLRLTFGDEHFEENLRFIEESLGKDLRKYFISDFYKDHVQRYKKRPIYWLFSSEQGSFNALIYMHRYNPSTASVVLNEYLRDFEAKLKTELGNQERISATSTNPRDKARADKETDRIRKVLLEISEYEHDILYPLATQQLTIDLDEGVKVNYSKFGSALKSIPGLGAIDE